MTIIRFDCGHSETFQHSSREAENGGFPLWNIDHSQCSECKVELDQRKQNLVDVEEQIAIRMAKLAEERVRLGLP